MAGADYSNYLFVNDKLVDGVCDVQIDFYKCKVEFNGQCVRVDQDNPYRLEMVSVGGWTIVSDYFYHHKNIHGLIFNAYHPLKDHVIRGASLFGEMEDNLVLKKCKDLEAMFKRFCQATETTYPGEQIVGVLTKDNHDRIRLGVIELCDRYLSDHGYSFRLTFPARICDGRVLKGMEVTKFKETGL